MFTAMNRNGRHVFRQPNFTNTVVGASKFALNMSRFVESVWSLEPNEHINSEKMHTHSSNILFAILLHFSGPGVCHFQILG